MDQVKSLVYVTSNELKFRVAAQSLQDSGIVLDRRALHTPEIQSSQVEEIAAWSAVWACHQLGQPVVTLDVGYSIEALNGFPGPFIKYVNEWFTAEDYLNLMRGKPDRRVAIREALAYCRPGEQPVLFSQRYQGEIALSPGKPVGTSINQVLIPEGFDRPISDIDEADMVAYWSKASIWRELRAHIEKGSRAA